MKIHQFRLLFWILKTWPRIQSSRLQKTSPLLAEITFKTTEYLTPVRPKTQAKSQRGISSISLFLNEISPDAATRAIKIVARPSIWFAQNVERTGFIWECKKLHANVESQSSGAGTLSGVDDESAAIRESFRIPHLQIQDAGCAPELP
jgi:hypothetical protein